MAIKQITKIMVETERIIVISRRARLIQGECEACAGMVAMLELEEATLAGVSPQSVARAIGRLHLIERADGVAFLCLNSLLK